MSPEPRRQPQPRAVVAEQAEEALPPTRPMASERGSLLVLSGHDPEGARRRARRSYGTAYDWLVRR